MECPQCHSDDVKRSRRTLLERLLLPMLRAQAFRCRDCRKRFWIGVQWSSVILGVLTMTMVAGVVTTMLVVHQARKDAQSVPPVAVKRYKRRRPSVPQGLPPLSSVPRPADVATASTK